MNFQAHTLASFHNSLASHGYGKDVALNLQPMLRSKKNLLRALATSLLSLLSGGDLSTNVSTLVSMLRDPSWEVCVIALMTLRNLNGAAQELNISAILSMLRHSAVQVRIEALKVLRTVNLDTCSHTTTLLKALLDDHLQVRKAAVKTVAEASRKCDAKLTKTCATAVANAMHDTSGDVKYAAAVALGDIVSRNPSLIKKVVLTKLLDQEGDVRRAGVLALKRLGEKALSSFTQELLRLTTDTDADVRLVAVETLDDISDEALISNGADAWVAQKIADDDADVRCFALGTLERFPATTIMIYEKEVHERLFDFDTDVVCSAIDLISKLNSSVFATHASDVLAALGCIWKIREENAEEVAGLRGRIAEVLNLMPDVVSRGLEFAPEHSLADFRKLQKKVKARLFWFKFRRNVLVAMVLRHWRKLGKKRRRCAALAEPGAVARKSRTR